MESSNAPPPGRTARVVDPGSLLDGRRLVFIGGLHRSGTSIVHRCLGDHPGVSGFRNTGAPEDEGQHLQSVYPPAAAYGGPGRFGFRQASFLDERSPLVTPANAARLLADWLRYWDASRPVLIEKSPPNLVRTRFLQAMFPEARFIVVMRHPIAVSYATKKWRPAMWVHRLIEHWLLCHERFEQDRPSLRRVRVLRYEDFVERPQEELSHLHAFLGLPGEPLRREVRRGVNDRYWAKWARRLTHPVTRRYATRVAQRLEERVRRFGYSLLRSA